MWDSSTSSLASAPIGNCPTRHLGNCRASAFRIADPTDKSGPEQRKLRSRVDSKIASSRDPQSGGRARPNEDVKLNRGGFYRMLWCLYWFLWEYNFITTRAALWALHDQFMNHCLSSISLCLVFKSIWIANDVLIKSKIRQKHIFRHGKH